MTAFFCVLAGFFFILWRSEMTDRKYYQANSDKYFRKWLEATSQPGDTNETGWRGKIKSKRG